MKTINLEKRTYKMKVNEVINRLEEFKKQEWNLITQQQIWHDMRTLANSILKEIGFMHKYNQENQITIEERKELFEDLLSITMLYNKLVISYNKYFKKQKDPRENNKKNFKGISDLESFEGRCRAELRSIDEGLLQKRRAIDMSSPNYVRPSFTVI